MIILDILGYIAGITIAVSMLPQVIKNFKEKSAKDISYPRCIIYLIGMFLLIIYCCFISAKVLIITNSFGFLLGVLSLATKIRYG